jgi:uncharacterized protein YuzE
MRCEKCKLFTRPDIAAAKGEGRCRCDAEFNEIYGQFRGMLNQNDALIEQLASKLNTNPQKWTLPATVTSESGESWSVGYIALQPDRRGQGVVKQTLIVRDNNDEEIGVHIDFDEDGRIFGIEVMDKALLPPKVKHE